MAFKIELMHMKIGATLLAFLLVGGCDKVQQPGSGLESVYQSYQDCIIKANVQQSEYYARRAGETACAKKFQTKIPASALSKIEGIPISSERMKLHFRINNRNEDWTITEIEYQIFDKSKAAAIETRRSDIKAESLRSDSIEIYMNRSYSNEYRSYTEQSDDFSWKLISAWGIQEKR